MLNECLHVSETYMVAQLTPLSPTHTMKGHSHWA